MKKLLIPLLLLLFMGCKVQQMQQTYLNMPEEQFKTIYESARVVELSEKRTVYKVFSPSSGTSYKFYYFKNGKLNLMDEGFVPYGTQSVVATPAESR